MNIIKTKDFEIQNVNPQIATIYPKNPNRDYTGADDNNLLIDFGQKKVGDITECNLLFKSDVMKITSVGSSCGCTTPVLTNIEEGLQQITVRFDSNKITKNVSKWVTLHLGNSEIKSIKINLVINKP